MHPVGFATTTTMSLSCRSRTVCMTGRRPDAPGGDFTDTVKRVLRMRNLEACQVKQLWTLANALDDVAREEMHATKTAVAATRDDVIHGNAGHGDNDASTRECIASEKNLWHSARE